MKILWLYRYLPQYDFDNWLHLKFVEVLKQQPGIEVLVYGPGIHDGYSHLTTLPYSSTITATDLKKHFDFDVVILNTKGRMFEQYYPYYQVVNYPECTHIREQGLEELLVGQWTPKGLHKLPVPRIMLEEDYHYEKDDLWYQQMRIDLILQRHYSQSLRQQVVPMKWFPFSVDINAFRPGRKERANRICFAGNTNTGCYRIRDTACKLLERQGLVDAYKNLEKVGGDYVRCLRQYVSHLCCSSTFRITPAKMFEIMASGSLLLTNHSEDLSQLFPEGSYRTYKDDGSDVAEVAREILRDDAGRAAAVQLGLDAVRARHSHEVRIGELRAIIDGLLHKGGPG